MLDLSDGKFLKLLRRIKLVTRKTFRGQKVGTRRVQEKGASVDFKDYKDYNPGDDPRFIDWNVYGRLDKVLVKVFHSEQDVNVYVLVDASRSMAFGEPVKFDYARRVAAAISYLCTTSNDRCRVILFGAGVGDQSPRAERPGHVLRLLRFLEKATAAGRSDLDATVRQFMVRHRRRGVVFLVSDLLTAEPPLEALRLLRHARYDANVIQVLAPDEIDPRMSGVFHLVDSEDESVREVFVDARTLAVYRQVLEERTTDVERFARQNGMTFLRVSTAEPFEDTVLRLFGCR